MVNSVTSGDNNGEETIILFATTTCPKCKMAVHFLEKAGSQFEEIFADQNPEMAEQFDIHQAPTLAVIKGDTVEKIVNLSNIKAYIEQREGAESYVRY